MTLPTGSIVGSSGSFYFPIWKGQVRPKQFVADFYSRIGQIGTGVQLLGAVGAPSTIQAVYLTSSQFDASSFAINVALLKGTYGNIVEPDGSTWTGALIKESIPTKHSGIYPFGGLTYRFCVIVDLLIEAQ